MADSVVKLKVESREYDAKLKRAQQGMQHLEQELHKAGKSFNDVDKNTLEYIRSIGSMETTSKTASGRVSEMTQAFVNLQRQYNHLSDDVKKGDVGKALAASMDTLRQRTIEAKQELQSLNRQIGNTNISGAGGSFGGSMLGGAKNIMGVLGVSPAMLTGIGAASVGFSALKGAIESNISTALNFERSMSQLSSLTGKTGEDLETLKEYAIELGSTSTLTASQVADAFKLIGSQQPQLLRSSEALKEVTKYAITLSEAAGIDLQTAAQTLSTSINQMGGDSNNAARYVNVLAAASQMGAGDIAWLGEAITKSATAARSVGTDYEELVGNLEQLAKGGFDASTAGTALRSIIMNLEKQANDNFKPSIVGLTQAFENMGKEEMSIVEYQQIAGKMFASQAMVLADNAAEARSLTKAITGTNIAEEQAATNADNLDGSLKSLSSAWEGLNLHINSSNGFLKETVDWLKNVVTWADQAFTAAGRAQKALAQMQGGGDGQPTKVDRQISALRGSNFKNVAYREELKRYDKDIADLQMNLDNFDKWSGKADAYSLGRKKIGTVYLSKEELEAQLAALKKMRNEYATKGESVIEAATKQVTEKTGGNNGKIDVSVDVDAETDKATKSIKQLQEEVKKLKKLRDDAANAGNTKLRDQYNAQIKQAQAEIKTMRGGGGTTHTASPAQQAEKSVSAALAKYNDATKLAAKQFEAGNITEAQYKKQLEQGQQRLYDAYGQAYQTYADPKYKEAQQRAADAIVKLGGEVQTATEAQKAAEEAARELKTAQKKLADAQTELANAQAIGDLSQIYAAEKKVKSAQTGLTAVRSGGQTESATVPVRITTANLDAFKKHLKEVIDTTDFGDPVMRSLEEQMSDVTALSTIFSTAIQNGIDTAQFDTSGLMKKLLDGENIEDSTIQDLVAQLNKKLEDTGGIQLAFNAKTGKVSQEKDDDKPMQQLQKATSGLSSVAGGLQQMGVKLPEGATKVIGAIQGLMTVIQGVQSIISIFSVSTAAAQTAATTVNTVMLTALNAQLPALITSINANTLTPSLFANGGVVRAAGGYTVPGSSFSGDRVPALLNSGEVVLNRAQQGVLADALQGGSRSMGTARASVSGEQIWIALNNFTKASGKGEVVTW